MDQSKLQDLVNQGALDISYDDVQPALNELYKLRKYAGNLRIENRELKEIIARMGKLLKDNR